MNSSISLMSRAKWIALTVVACIGLDQYTKDIAKTHLNLADYHSFLGDTVRFGLAHNRGAFLGLGDSLPDWIREPLLTGGVGLLLIGLLIYALRTKLMDRNSVIALALIFAGGISNLGDRIVYGGYVVDFVQMGVGPVRTGVFNIADMAIMGGTFWLLIDSIRQMRAAKKAEQAAKKHSAH